jgi:DNA polymerase-1
MALLMTADGTNLLHRSYHAMEATAMRGPSGQALWAVHGIVGSLAKYIDAIGPSSMLVTFDVQGGCPSRKALAPSYKLGRSETPPELTEQLLLSHEVLLACGIACASEQDWEADDLLASSAVLASSRGAHTAIVSADKDAHQLINDLVRVYKPEGHFLDAKGLVEKYGVSGDRWVEYTAMVGEGADNLSGVTGVGPKRAALLIGAFSDIEEAIADPQKAATVVPAKVAQALVDGADVFRRNRLVGQLRTDIPIDLAGLRLASLDLGRIRDTCAAHYIPQAGARLASAIERALV